MKKTNVISSDLDGAELRREKSKNSYYATCSGKADSEVINDVIKNTPKGKLWSVGDAWNRIFGGR